MSKFSVGQLVTVTGSVDGSFVGSASATIVNPHSNAGDVTATKGKRQFSGAHVHIPQATVQIDRAKRGLPSLRFDAPHHQLTVSNQPLAADEQTITVVVGHGLEQVLQLDEASMFPGLTVIRKNKAQILLSGLRPVLVSVLTDCVRRQSNDWDQPLWYASCAKAAEKHLRAALGLEGR